MTAPRRSGAHRATPRDIAMGYRIRVLPDQLDRARHRVRMLENEARRYGMTDLLESHQQ